MTYETIAVERIEDHIERVTLDRPRFANALDTRMGRELVDYFEALALEPERARCVILTGRGDKAFCAGGDLKERDGMTTPQWRAQHLVFERMARALRCTPPRASLSARRLGILDAPSSPVAGGARESYDRLRPDGRSVPWESTTPCSTFNC